ncbi:mitochondrial succinate dehydrogenase complex subunit D [Pelomyxa schiedti]|nr:mitochondrial succinate dehydrogenase complex subunit D [Pelomyxa schiedti]
MAVRGWVRPLRGGVLWTPRLNRKIYSYSAVGLSVLLPLCVTTTSGKLNSISNHAVGLLLPLHFFLGCSRITQDYVFAPKKRAATMFAVSSFSILTAFAALHCNRNQGGISEAVKFFWRL